MFLQWEGGREQEVALPVALERKGMENVALSAGTDWTDEPAIIPAR